MGELPLTTGAAGEAVRDLQLRLAGIGFDARAEFGRFGARTEDAVRRFQDQRGLRATGECDGVTWAALVEAGYRLGDRLLYLGAPMQRGDDVAELQRRLGSLGFDAGRVDGIFGPNTELALKDFQRNVGLTTDGVCGPDVLDGLTRLRSRIDADASVAGVRERDRLRHAPRALNGRRLAVGDAGGLAVVADALAHALRDAGATVAVLRHPDPSNQAAEANLFGAEAFVGVALDETGPCCVAFYSTPGFESTGGRRLAELAVDMLGTETDLDVESPKGMRLPVLRETRMPAVMCFVGPPTPVVANSSTLARGLAAVLERWAEAPVEG
jgi:N-acetylmuramoyl-L-alanine amidase